MIHRTASALALMATLTLGACKGGDGPMGPQGPPGPAGAQGPAGTVTKFQRSGIISGDGTASASLPAAAGTLASPPVFMCFQRPQGTAAWLLVLDGEGPNTSFCAIGLVSGTLTIILVRGVPGWEYNIVAYW